MTADSPSVAVADAFSRAATAYDHHATLQRRAATALMAGLPAEMPADVGPAQVLDLGCGTGDLARRLRARFPGAAIDGFDIAPGMVAACREAWADDPWARFVIADIGSAANRIQADIIASSFALQWLADGPTCVAGWSEMVRPGGVLAIAVPVAGSLAGLAARYEAMTGRRFPGLDYATAERYTAAVQAAGLEVVHRAHEDLAMPDGDSLELLRCLRKLGATGTPRNDHRPVSAGELRRVLRAQIAPAERAGNGFRMLYLVARRGEGA